MTARSRVAKKRSIVSCVRVNLSMSSAYSHASILATTLLSPFAVRCVIYFVAVTVLYVHHFELQSFGFLRIHAFMLFVFCIHYKYHTTWGKHLLARCIVVRDPTPIALWGVVPMFLFWFQIVGHLTFHYCCKSSRHVAHQWRDVIINIQRSRTPLSSKNASFRCNLY